MCIRDRVYIYDKRKDTFVLKCNLQKILLSISLLALAYTASANVPVIKSDPKIEAQVEQTLKKLTLEEKMCIRDRIRTDAYTKACREIRRKA